MELVKLSQNELRYNYSKYLAMVREKRAIIIVKWFHVDAMVILPVEEWIKLNELAKEKASANI